ncbi:MAG: prenyltransferase/squalene oxidase repeat-containing protein [Nitrospira sp.]
MASVFPKRMIREELLRRFLPDGGIVDRPRGQFRADSTAWGILAFGAAGGEHDILERHRLRLSHEQNEDGRLSVSRGHPDSYWPTALAALAWQDSSHSQASQGRAIRFLLETTGVHRPRRSDELAAHDTLLKGWPWVGGTHSWIEPTALSVIALKAAGHEQHDRVREAIRMMLDRQLPHGGWNYGNTLVFGRELRPMPESTGAALTGLAGAVGQEKVARSIEYLQGEVDRLRTPISLGWALLGLAAWDRGPSKGAAFVERCLANRTRYGEYDTSALCLLFLGALAGEPDTRSPLFLHSGRNPVPAALTQ